METCLHWISIRILPLFLSHLQTYLHWMTIRISPLFTLIQPENIFALTTITLIHPYLIYRHIYIESPPEYHPYVCYMTLLHAPCMVSIQSYQIHWFMWWCQPDSSTYIFAICHWPHHCYSVNIHLTFCLVLLLISALSLCFSVTHSIFIILGYTSLLANLITHHGEEDKKIGRNFLKTQYLLPLTERSHGRFLRHTY